jgi:hypothetical protein
MAWLAADQITPIIPPTEAFIRSVITQFCHDTLSIDDCKSMLSPYIIRTGAIDRLNAILRCHSHPFPAFPESLPPAGRGKKRAKPWTAPEDDRLLCAIHRYGVRAWPAVAEFVGNGRERTQCAQRWFRGLDPRISKDDWSDAEDLRLVQLVVLRGEAGWTWISREMGNRSDVQCRYRYLQLKRCGRGAELLPSAATGVTTSQYVRRQIAQLMAKKKGRPMKTQLPIVIGNAVVEGGAVREPPEGRVEKKGEPTGGTDEESSDLFIEWTGERAEDQEEGLTW